MTTECLLCDNVATVIYAHEPLCSGHALEYLGDVAVSDYEIRLELTSFIGGSL